MFFCIEEGSFFFPSFSLSPTSLYPNFLPSLSASLFLVFLLLSPFLTLLPSSLSSSLLPLSSSLSPFSHATLLSPALVYLVLTLPPAVLMQMHHGKCGLDIQKVAGLENITVFGETLTPKTFKTHARTHVFSPQMRAVSHNVPCWSLLSIHLPLVVTIVTISPSCQ